MPPLLTAYQIADFEQRGVRVIERGVGCLELRHERVDSLGVGKPVILVRFPQLVERRRHLINGRHADLDEMKLVGLIKLD